MMYYVILTECGQIKHSWLYESYDYPAALKQFASLNECFSEVNEVQVFMFKTGPCFDKSILFDLIKQICLVS